MLKKQNLRLAFKKRFPKIQGLCSESEGFLSGAKVQFSGHKVLFGGEGTVSAGRILA